MIKTLTIKNMVCNRCIKVVRDEFEKMGIVVTEIKLGSVTIQYPGDNLNEGAIEQMLIENGFELLIDSKAQIIEKIKTLLISLIYSDALENSVENVSDYLAHEIGKDYSSLSHLFSLVEGITIEKYFILQKVERAKELIVYNDLNLSEIANKLGYSSVQYLSIQFKKVTGMTPSRFKNLKNDQRVSLDKINSNRD